MIIVELNASSYDSNPIPPPAIKVLVNELFESFGAAPDFPSIEELQAKAWPSKW